MAERDGAAIGVDAGGGVVEPKFSGDRQGLGGEAWNAVVDYLLGPAGMRKVTAGAIAENEAMVAIMRASGMAEEGRRRNQMLLGDRPVDVIVTGRLADV